MDARFLPEGEEDAIDLAVAKDDKEGAEVKVKMFKVKEDKKVKIVVAGSKFAIEEDESSEVMLEFFRGKVAAFRDRKALMFSSARVGKVTVLSSLLDAHPDVDVNATNLRGETPLILAVRNGQVKGKFYFFSIFAVF